ncbi:MAG: thermonuclease family protein [Nitrospirota bacterium]|nr:thermonuclease family protein [Nitrospirota bacterium]
MTKKQIKISSMTILTIIALLYGCMADNTPEAKKLDENKSVYIEKVVDGDSVEANIRGKKEQIRFIGIDAPELSQKPWGKRSRKFLEELISASGWQVRIEYDVEKRDKYDRILAYLWGRDHKLINEEMLSNGYAVLFTFPPNVKHVDRLKAAQVIARENKRGIWGKGGLKQLPSDYRKEHPRR